MGERGVVVVSFDIFKLEKEGPLWRGTATTLDEAAQRVEELGRDEPSEYLIVNHRTGERVQIKAPAGRRGAGGSSQAAPTDRTRQP
jgi:hypothetical protein